jgi:hypothetical protein
VNASHHRSLLEFSGAPKPVQRLARQNFELLKENPAHPSLHFKKIGKLWSARVGINYPAVAVEDGADFIWVWIGPHDEYQRLIKQQG